MITLTQEQLRKLTDAHLSHFWSMIDQANRGVPGVRIDECRQYMTLWRSIESKGYKGLNDREIGEIYDAVTCGDYDELLGIEGEDGIDTQALR